MKQAEGSLFLLVVVVVVVADVAEGLSDCFYTLA